MSYQQNDFTPEGQIRHLYSSKIAASGGIVRRKKSDVERLIGLGRFMADIHRRGFQAFENGGYIIVVCNREPLRRL